MSNTYYQRPNNSEKRNQEYQQQQFGNVRQFVVGKQNTVIDWVTGIILVVLSISLVVAIIVLCVEIRDINRYRERDANSFWWAYESGRYANSIKERYGNQYNHVRETSELNQCYAVSEYFEAASLYKVAVVTGKMDKAQEYMAVMEAALEEMDDVDYLAEEINAKLGIEDFAE